MVRPLAITQDIRQTLYLNFCVHSCRYMSVKCACFFVLRDFELQPSSSIFEIGKLAMASIRPRYGHEHEQDYGWLLCCHHICATLFCHSLLAFIYFHWHYLLCKLVNGSISLNNWIYY